MSEKHYEITDDYIIWKTDQSEYNNPKDFKILLPNPPDNIGWFKIEFMNGTGFTIYDIEAMIDKFCMDESICEQYEQNEGIYFKRDLVELLEKNKALTPKELAETLTDYYKLEKY